MGPYFGYINLDLANLCSHKGRLEASKLVVLQEVDILIARVNLTI